MQQQQRINITRLNGLDGNNLKEEDFTYEEIVELKEEFINHFIEFVMYTNADDFFNVIFKYSRDDNMRQIVNSSIDEPLINFISILKTDFNKMHKMNFFIKYWITGEYNNSLCNIDHTLSEEFDELLTEHIQFIDENNLPHKKYSFPNLNEDMMRYYITEIYIKNIPILQQKMVKNANKI